ncbi:MAG: hypothetical protein HJJLKODD_01217 [Phycisphaerae bacterium]|nr:hypothetical protein [Phycisphaerae bacterium]
MNELLVIMYHYVRSPDPQRWGGIFPLAPQEFEQQLDYLATIGRFVHPDEIHKPAGNQQPQILLTFDDGTIDHYEVVFPILQRRRLSGLFGVISGPALTGEVPSFHLLHHLTSLLPDATLWNNIRKQFTVQLSDEPHTSALEDQALPRAGNNLLKTRARNMYSRDTVERAQIKYALNFVLDQKTARQFLLTELRRLGRDPRQIVESWYLQPKHIREMHHAGQVFASHAHRHLPFFTPVGDYDQMELQPCEMWLTELLGQPPRHYIAAFGGSNAAGSCIIDLAPILRQRGYSAGYLTQPGTNPAPPAKFFLKRFDTVSFPPRSTTSVHTV